MIETLFESLMGKLNPYMWLIKLVGIGIMLLALWYAWHQFTGHYIDIGKAARQPEVDALAADKKTLQDAYADLGTQATACSDSVNALAAASDKRKAAAAAALVEAEKRASGLQQQAAWLSEQLNKPGIETKSCGDALKEWRTQP